MKHCVIRALRPFEGSIIFAHVETRCRADGLVEAVLTGQTELPIECATFAAAYTQFEVEVVDGAAPPLVPQGLRIAQPWHGMVPTVPTLDELVTSGVAEADAEAIRDHEARCAEAGLWPYGVNPPPGVWTDYLAQRDPPAPEPVLVVVEPVVEPTPPPPPRPPPPPPPTPPPSPPPSPLRPRTCLTSRRGAPH